MLTSTIFGMELSGGVETYKVLDQRQLAAAPATIYTVPASTVAFIKTICVVNNDTVARTFQYFTGGTTAPYALTGVFTLGAGWTAVYEDGQGWKFYNLTGQLLTAYGQASVYDIWGPTGCLGETMDRNVCPEVNTTLTTTGQIYLQAIFLTAGTIVTNISM
jgi:hypothetical protein